MSNINKDDSIKKLTEVAHNQFLLLVEDNHLKDEDFNGFALGYTFGMLATADTVSKDSLDIEKLADDLLGIHCNNCEGQSHGCTGCSVRKEIINKLNFTLKLNK